VTKKTDIALLNAFKTYAEAEDYRHKLESPDDHGIISMVGKDKLELHTVMLKDALHQIEKVYGIE
jgi:hypothetical protein